MILTNSGSQIAARNPNCSDVNQGAATALREIRDLFLLRGFILMVDTTDTPDVLAAKVHKRLSRELFSF